MTIVGRGSSGMYIMKDSWNGVITMMREQNISALENQRMSERPVYVYFNQLKTYPEK